MKYFSLEQFICAALANYKDHLTRMDIAKLLKDMKCYMQDWQIATDVVRYTLSYIDYSGSSVGLKDEYSLESNIFVGNKMVTLQSFFEYLAGEDLLSFMLSERNNNLNL